MTLAGEFKSLYRIPAPAYIHSSYTTLELQGNDMRFCSYLRKAQQCTDPIERLKNIVVFSVACNYINPTLNQCLVPLNPIIGETLQREMPTGETFFAE